MTWGLSFPPLSFYPDPMAWFADRRFHNLQVINIRRSVKKVKCLCCGAQDWDNGERNRTVIPGKCDTCGRPRAERCRKCTYDMCKFCLFNMQPCQHCGKVLEDSAKVRASTVSFLCCCMRIWEAANISLSVLGASVCGHSVDLNGYDHSRIIS